METKIHHAAKPDASETRMDDEFDEEYQTFCSGLFGKLKTVTEDHMQKIQKEGETKFKAFRTELKNATDNRIKIWREENLEKQNRFVEAKRDKMKKTLSQTLSKIQEAHQDRMKAIKNNVDVAENEMNIRVAKKTEEIEIENKRKIKETEDKYKKLLEKAIGEAEYMRKSMNALLLSTDFELEKNNLMMIENGRELEEKLMEMERVRQRMLLDINWVEEKDKITTELFEEQDGEQKKLVQLNEEYMMVQMDFMSRQAREQKEITTFRQKSETKLRTSLLKLKSHHDEKMANIRNVSFDVGREEELAFLGERSFEMHMPNVSFETIRKEVEQAHEEQVEGEKKDLTGFHGNYMKELQSEQGDLQTEIDKIKKKRREDISVLTSK
jgi:hypothetical protein